MYKNIFKQEVITMKGFKNIIFGTIISMIFLIGIFTGCSSVKVKPSPLQKIGAPPWVYKGGGAFKGKEGRVFYGVGSVSGIHNRGLAMSAADNRARNELAKVFQVYVSSLMKDYASSSVAQEMSSPEETQLIEQAIKTVTSITLSGVEIVDRWEDPRNGDMYSLARVNLETFKQNLEKMQSINKKVREFLRESADKLHEELIQEEEKLKNQ